MQWLEELEAVGFHLNRIDEPKRPLIDIWAEPSTVRKHADVMVAPEFLDSDIDRQKREILLANKYRTKRNTDRSNEKETSEEGEHSSKRNDQSNARKRRSDAQVAAGADSFNLLQYHRYDEILQYMHDLSEKYPHLVSEFNVTKSFEGRDLRGIKLVNGYGHDEEITKMVDTFDWYFVPVANPDGYEYSMTIVLGTSEFKDRLWRKTRSRNTTVNKWCVGVDANRNWGYRWGEAGANRSPCSNIYHGAEPFSEVEVSGIRDFTTWQIPELKIYVSLHSYGQVFLTPWGYTKDKPFNYYDQKTAARLAVEAIKNKTGAAYTYGTISELMYPASGTSIDYMQSKGVPYIYGIELRPEDVDNNFGFTIPAKYIEPTGEEMLSAFLTMTRYATSVQTTYTYV
ncbi:unnamed protein product [Anisakis simplex]|uniref:Subfamily M14A unassigned peptidase (inferred by orthology to a S. mansoni protein) n=1 Tax=Anisakis simplex TaxID=6269 RepID=A0A0M3IYU8_ANISI|nr:unnamed protein product [Anisakis simplex]